MNKKQIAITLGIMCFILTVAICVQLKTVENTTSTVSQSLKENGLRDEVLKWKERYDNAYEELTKSNKDLEEIRKSATQNDTKSQAKQEEIEKNNMLLGLQEVKGEGLLIKLADNNTGILKNGSEALDPSSQIVHYDDLIEVINALNNAGAEAISINGVRILSMTDIVDIDSYILIKPRQRLISPYVVKAIGNQTYLTSTLCMKNSGFIDSYKNSGKTVTLEKQRNIKIPKYSENIDIKYMKEVAGE